MPQTTSEFGLKIETKRNSRFSKVFPALVLLGINEFEGSASSIRLKRMFPRGAALMFEANEDRAVIWIKGDIDANLNDKKNVQ